MWLEGLLTHRVSRARKGVTRLQQVILRQSWITSWTRERGPDTTRVSLSRLWKTRCVTHNGCSCWQIHLRKILPPVPFEWCREESRPLRISPEATKG